MSDNFEQDEERAVRSTMYSKLTPRGGGKSAQMQALLSATAARDALGVECAKYLVEHCFTRAPEKLLTILESFQKAESALAKLKEQSDGT